MLYWALEFDLIRAVRHVRLIVVNIFAVLLVIGYTNTFEVWQFIGTVISREQRDAVPFIVVGIMFLLVAIVFVTGARARRVSISWQWLALAVVAVLVGLASTDPAFPAKRIHVPQYLFLACVLSLSIRAQARTRWTLFFVFLATSLYGVHDEFLQGLHPSRTFGFRDMITNTCGAAAGTFLVQSLSFQRGSQEPASKPGQALGPWVLWALFFTTVGVVQYVMASIGFRFGLVPYWTILPLLAAVFALSLAAEHCPEPADRAALRGLVGVCLVFALYPMVINVAFLDFA